MTDEDDNDRMERANRIREMREGRHRGGDDDEESDDPDESGGDDSGADTGAADDAEPETDDESEPEEPEVEATDEIDDAEPEPAVESETDDEPEPAADETDHTDDAGGFEFEGDDEHEDEDDADAGEKVETEEPAADRMDATAERDVADAVGDADAADAVDDLGIGGTFTIPDQATTVTEQDQQAMLEGAEQSVAAARAAVAGRDTAHTGDRTRVLEFELGDERFCLDIDYIEEIVELENMTRVPNSPSYVEGVVDLRGQVTAIINPKDALDVETDSQGELIIVFDSEAINEQGYLGWVVDEVRQVSPVSEDEVNESPEDEDEGHINGIINREDEDDFIVWTTPDLALNSS